MDSDNIKQKQDFCINNLNKYIIKNSKLFTIID